MVTAGAYGRQARAGPRVAMKPRLSQQGSTHGQRSSGARSLIASDPRDAQTHARTWSSTGGDLHRSGRGGGHGVRTILRRRRAGVPDSVGAVGSVGAGPEVSP